MSATCVATCRALWCSDRPLAFDCQMSLLRIPSPSVKQQAWMRWWAADLQGDDCVQFAEIFAMDQFGAGYEPLFMARALVKCMLGIGVPCQRDRRRGSGCFTVVDKGMTWRGRRCRLRGSHCARGLGILSGGWRSAAGSCGCSGRS